MFKKIVKFTLLLVLIFCIIFSIIEINSQRPVQVLKSLLKKDGLSSQGFKLKLNFLLVIPVGEAKIENLGIETFRNRELIHIRAQAESLNYFKSLFYAKANINSYIEPKELDSIYFMQHLEISNKPNDDREISYDQKRHIMRYQGLRGVEERVIDEHAQDPLSAIFYIQNKVFNINEEFKLSMNTNQKNYILKARVIAKESIQVAHKNYELWVIQASVARKDKNPRHKTSFKIWFLDNGSQKIPLLIKATTNIGPIVAKAN
ncbi:MAG: DUF3108 domain-containing protein [Candidatus Omnitrophota bacterium]|nr:DUF3108 domain-containing protein [Candidatus Omnitrophota bacterium]